jgi:xylulokinase
VAAGERYDALTEEAARWPAGTDGLLFLPYLAGERTPYPDPDARGAFIGLELRHDRGALVRAVLEGVAYGLRDSLDLICELGGTPAFARVSGGGAASRLWLQIVASVLELPLERVAVDEGAAFGAAILGGVAAQIWPDVGTAVAATVRPGERIEPVPEWVEVYRERRARYQALYPALRDLPG